MRAKCPMCKKEFDLGERVLGKIGGAIAGGMLVGGATEHPLGVLAGALAGGLLGHWIDTEVLPTCPTCVTALEILEVIA